MQEQLQWILSTWNSYWGDGIYQYLLLLSLLFLLFRRRRQRSTWQTVSYTILFLLIFFIPATAAIIQKCIGKDVYWRVLWLLPTTAVIALAAAELLSDIGRFLSARTSSRTESSSASGCRKKLCWLCLIPVTALCAVFCVKGMMASDNYVKVSNYQKVPEEVAHICNMVLEHAQGETIKLAADEHVCSYVRVYDASIQMPYGRRGQGASGKATKELYSLMCSESPDYARIAELALETSCNFLILAPDSDSVSDIFSEYGYQLIGSVNSYQIFTKG